MHHHALAPVSLDPGDFWHSWELLFQSFSVGLTFIRMNGAGEVQLAEKPPWGHPLFHERRSDAYCISIQGPPERRHQNPFNLFVRWKNPGTKVDHPTNQWTAKGYLSSGLPVARYSQLLVSFGLCGNHISIRVARHGPMTKSEKLLKMRENRISPCHVFSGLVCFVWNSPGTNTPSGSRRLITSNKGRPRCDPSRPGCLYLQSQRGQICHPACNGSRALSLIERAGIPGKLSLEARTKLSFPSGKGPL